MPTTRSAGKRQKSLEDYDIDKNVKLGTVTTAPANSDPPKPQPRRSTTHSKRKNVASQAERPSKRSKHKSQSVGPATQAQVPNQSVDPGQSILINRAPVLTLWAAVVASFLHPDEDWTTCLAIGSSISSLCAISKGRAIGQIRPKDESTKAEDGHGVENRQTQDDIREREVMGFPMQVDAGGVVVSANKKPVNEQNLQAKYGGEEEYAHVKRIMEQALQAWADDKQELDKKAFHMYERFRPSIATGSAGWGRKGPLDLKKVKSTIESHS